MNGLITLNRRAKSVYLASLLMLVCLAPGCLEDSVEDSVDESELYQGETSTVTMEIIHGDSVANATGNYTIEIEL